ncbi:family 10 glycosylhydrolase [Prevotella sp. A2931]|uniref:Family 10 glycosylhydrolase n=2 Tax=Prevotellaceae TaxID=171552 RepID=A0ABS3M2G7_9BACT|nr:MULTISPECIES: alpha amylase family protein [Prevotella]MBO1362331.1 family 10 glycosylhydrolase [Prevotella illustrans]PTL26423.1 S-layer protein [Prevotella sp. oral taxon 820]
MIQTLLLSSLLLFSSCGSGDKPDNGGTTPPTPTPGGETVHKAAKPRYIWIDAPANFSRFANSKENIREDLKRAKEAGFTHIVVDVRPYTGDILFKSAAGHAVEQLDYWEGSAYKYYKRTADWDYLQAFIDIGHELGLRVDAAMNTFVGGSMNPYGLGGQGMLFRESGKKGWASTYYLGSGLTNGMDLPVDAGNYYATRFLNPCNDDVQAYLLDLIGDLARYDLDAIILDRCRYDNLQADFSDDAKTKFQAYMKAKGVTSFAFPQDVAKAGSEGYAGQPAYFKDWLAFRAKTIYDFMGKVVARVRGVNSNVKVGAYVGAWYSDYYHSGVNWASRDYDPAVDYPEWANTDYRKYGFANKLDVLLLGCYAGASSVYGTTEWTMQGFCTQAAAKLKGDVKFAGGPDVGNPDGFPQGNQATAVTNSVDACINASDGYFVFDMVHVRQFNYWNALKTGIDRYLNSLK